MHLNSELLFRKYFPKYFKSNIKVLEIGPAGIPSAYSKIVNDSTIQWDTLDFDSTKFIASSTSKLTYKITEPYDFPVPSDTYDIVLSGQVIEHVQEIWTWMNELKRVTKKNGLIITINPVSWPYHEAPIDCWRIFPSGITALAKYCNLEVVHCTFESIELEQLLSKHKYIPRIPGKSYNYGKSTFYTKSVILWNRIVRLIPFVKKIITIPIEVSYDTISILKKL
ncbi:MAG: methyltransferase domain-containing protein [Bacteroidota bacterium]|jgi:SAM-dependent methyltransferase